MAALLKHHEKQAKSADRAMKRGSKKNAKPEKEVEAKVLSLASRLGFDLHVVESKAVYSKAAGRYVRSMTSESLPDLVGSHAGLSVWVELKARGRLSTLKSHQREFLKRKIMAGCFACCVDSADMFGHLWETYLITPEVDRIDLLMQALP